MLAVTRSHEICIAHRLYGHQGNCSRLHGHNYHIEIEIVSISGDTNYLGMVMDFGDIKSMLCAWLDENWDHRTMLYKGDDLLADGAFEQIMHTHAPGSLLVMDFNPTAENMADYLVKTIFPELLNKMEKYLNVAIRSVKIHETQKCSATSWNVKI